MLFKTLVALTLLAVANAECPNACSGHGTCGKYDMCSCFDRWTNNDCGERVCPYGFSFVTTPQGDLNMDGDRYDNTQKLIVKQIGGAANLGSVTENDNVLTLEVTIANTAAEDLVVGDALRVGDETFVVSAVAANLITLDHDRFTTISSQPVYKYVETIQAPKGTWESWAGDYNEDDEGHYYMECSNRGLCDRKEGLCTCFDGYDGSACQRQSCPNDCSGHGTCETIAELSKQNATLFTNFHVDTATAGSSSITMTRDPAADSANHQDSTTDPVYAKLAVGDVISLGKPNGQQLTVMTIDTVSNGASTGTITTDPATTNSFMHGTRVYRTTTYDLWDSGKDRACMCDYSYTGADCSMRDCPHGDDPLTTQNGISTPSWIKDQSYANGATGTDASLTSTSATLTFARARHGTASYDQRNEKQSVYLDTMRGSLSGSFTLTFTDAFGQKWTTTAIDVNGRLSSKAYISSTALTTVTFSPSLPYGELTAGDFIMVGDERREVLTTYPVVDTTTSRPVKLGGVVDSVLVRNNFYAAVSDAYAFRAGPAKGIEDALEGLPNGVIEGVTTETFNAGALIGFAREGITTTSGLSYFAGIIGDYDEDSDRGAATHTHPDVAGSTGPSAGESYALGRTNGGLAPYDMVRVTSASGYSEFAQLKHVDFSATTGRLVHATAKGTLTAQTTANSGIGATKTGAIYRQGGYHIRVTFDTNSGDLQELDVDTDGLYSVFFREFTGTVYAKEPTRVVARSHDGNDITVHGDMKTTAKYTSGSGAYPIPYKYFDTSSNHHSGRSATMLSSNIPHSINDQTNQETFRGAQFDLKLMAGMKVKIGNQVRTVVKDIDDSERSTDGDLLADGTTAEAKHVAAFHVDAPFEANDQSRRVGDDDYIFHEYPVEQLYDEATYNSLAVAQAVFVNKKQFLGVTDLQQAGANALTGGGAYGIALSSVATSTDSAVIARTSVATTGYYQSGTGSDAVGYGAHHYTGLEKGNRVYGFDQSLGSALGVGNVWVVQDDPSDDATTTTCSAFQPNEFVTVMGTNEWLLQDGQMSLVHATTTNTMGGSPDGVAYTGNYDSGAGSYDDDVTEVAATVTPVAGCVLRTYKGLNSFEDEAGPPLALNGQTRWALVTDQRPLRWNSPTVANSAMSTIGYSLAKVADRGILGAGGGAFTHTLSANGASGTYFIGVATSATPSTTTTTATLTFNGFGGTTTSSTNLAPLGSMLGLATTEKAYVRISGCTVDVEFNGEWMTTYTQNAATPSLTLDGATADDVFVADTELQVPGKEWASRPCTNCDRYLSGITTLVTTAMCAGDTVTFTTRIGSLIDSKAIAIGDRVKVKSGTLGSYDTRTVDKIWGTGLDVSMFSVIDAFATTGDNAAARDISDNVGGRYEVFVDESGSTEDITCSRRGLCDGDTGVCACFAGYTTANCGTQNALAS